MEKATTLIVAQGRNLEDAQRDLDRKLASPTIQSKYVSYKIKSASTNIQTDGSVVITMVIYWD